MEIPNRRPLKTRSAAWAGATARWLAGTGLTPNAVSVIGIGFALLGAWAMVASVGAATAVGRAALLVGGAVGVQLRLLCNMLDGLIAVENNLKSKLGDLFNEAPDRIEDTALLLGAGWAAGNFTLGWAAALCAVGTAYVRVLGGSLGFKQDFCGPMAKQHRMFFVTVACLGGALEAVATKTNYMLPAIMGLIVAGAAVTIIRRLGRVGRLMQAR